MKYGVLIIDGAAGLPLPERGGKTSLELARTPNLDAIAREGTVGLARTIPAGMELGSANACMSLLGYDPRVHYRGRSAIEARSLGIPVGRDEATFRCNLVTVSDGQMQDYSAGYITSGEASELMTALNASLSNEGLRFYPGVSYRNILKIKGRPEVLEAVCTPPHDITGKPVSEFLPRGPGSELLRDLMQRSEAVLADHPVNVNRRSQGKPAATTIWLFWGSAGAPDMPSFREAYGLKAAVSSGVDILKGLALMMGMGVLDIPGVTDGLDNDFAAQASGSLAALGEYDLTVIHVEAPDEAAHSGSIDNKVAAIERVDREVVGRLRDWQEEPLRLLIMPDHPTPIATRTHSADPVPFILWGPGFNANGAARFTEKWAAETNLLLDPGHSIMSRLIRN